MSPFKAIIYDCDGVLFESKRANLSYYNKIQSYFGEPPVLVEDRERAHLCHTAASPQVLEVLLGQERLPAALAYAANIDYREFIPEMDPEPGLSESLALLSRHVPLAVATNRGYSMREILEHFKLVDFFQVVVTSRDVERPKPYPDMLILAAQRLGFASGDLLFVGDSELDRDAAACAGIAFASYKRDLGADLHLESHTALVEMLLPNG